MNMGLRKPLWVAVSMKLTLLSLLRDPFQLVIPSRTQCFTSSIPKCSLCPFNPLGSYISAALALLEVIWGRLNSLPRGLCLTHFLPVPENGYIRPATWPDMTLTARFVSY